MKDASGQPICPYDLVTFETTGAHGDRGLVLEAKPGKKLGVACVDGTEETKEACHVTVVDRSFFAPGEAVTSALDPGGQAGVVTGVSVALDLVQLDGERAVVATDVPAAELRDVEGFSLGEYIVSGPWLGRVVEQSVDVDVLFEDDLSVCRVTGASKKLRAVGRDYLSRHNNYNSLYPGQGVVGKSSVFKASRWLKGYWKPSRVKGTVAKVELSGVLVYWVASPHTGTDRHIVQAAAPPAYQPNSRNLTSFCPGHALDYTFWAVSNRCFFLSPHRRPSPAAATTHDHQVPSAPASGLTTKTHRHHRLRMGIKRARRVDRSRRAQLQPPMYVADTRTTVDVLWQDGTRQSGLPSASLLPFAVRNEHDFFPGQRVIPIARDDNATTGPATARVGLVKSHNYKDQTACVSWFTTSSEVDCDDDAMSVYDLSHSLDHCFQHGDIVIRLRPTKSAADDGGGGSMEEEPVPVPAAATHDLSWVGHIVDLYDAHYIHVKWGDGNTSKVLPHEIASVKPKSVAEMLQEMGDWVHDDGDNDDAAAIDKAQENTPHEPPATTDTNDGADSGDDSDGTSDAQGDDDPVAARATTGRMGATAIIQAAIRIAGGVLGQGKRCLVSGSMASASTSEPATSSGDGGGDMKEAVATVAAPSSENGGDGCAEQGMAGTDATGGDHLFHFPHFELVQSPPDHHYLDNKKQGTGGGRKWLKRVQKEWQILGNNLPDTIYVRAFEDRMDLLRVAMVGASGTPYHDGLFFFDLQLPSSYPAKPPLVNYHSFGLRVNPNLYPSGTVCLSLLDTFGGEGTELWSAEASSVLQVVVSIQGLVLTAQPYYNEAGYAAQVGTLEGQRNELPYGENTYLLNLYTMLHLIRRPPVGFEAFVMDHFRRRGRHVLGACEAYLEGCRCPLGKLDGEEVSCKEGASMGFRLALANVVQRLVEAFTRIGAQGCDRLRVPPPGCTPLSRNY